MTVSSSKARPWFSHGQRSGRTKRGSTINRLKGGNSRSWEPAFRLKPGDAPRGRSPCRESPSTGPTFSSLSRRGTERRLEPGPSIRNSRTASPLLKRTSDSRLVRVGGTARGARGPDEAHSQNRRRQCLPTVRVASARRLPSLGCHSAAASHRAAGDEPRKAGAPGRWDTTARSVKVSGEHHRFRPRQNPACQLAGPDLTLLTRF